MIYLDIEIIYNSKDIRILKARANMFGGCNVIAFGDNKNCHDTYFYVCWALTMTIGRYY